MKTDITVRGPAKDTRRSRRHKAFVEAYGRRLIARYNDGRAVELCWMGGRWTDNVRIALDIIYQVPALEFGDRGVAVTKALKVLDDWLQSAEEGK